MTDVMLLMVSLDIILMELDIVNTAVVICMMSNMVDVRIRERLVVRNLVPRNHVPRRHANLVVNDEVQELNFLQHPHVCR